jgi:hypothetical protein
MDAPLLEHLKDIAETIALACGGIYFGYKTFTGYFRVNLSLSVKCSREKHSGTEDWLVVSVTLDKGPNGSLTLHDVQARVSYAGSEQVVTFPGIERSSYEDTGTPSLRKVISWGRVSTSSPHLKIVPGEKTELTTYCKVPGGEVCLVEVAVLGQQTNKKPFGQWKASCVSLPKAEQDRGQILT